jgi:hypothetical protein
MKQVTDNFKNNIKTYGRQFNFDIKINDVDISDDDINYIKPSFNSTLFQTIMHQIEIDSKNKIPLKSTIKVKAGVKVNEPEYEYVSYNTCIVNSSEKQEDNNSYVSLAYDKMIESMIDYDLIISEKITLREYLIKICERLGWNTNNIPATFINSDKLVDPRLHVGIDYTFRDVLDEIATISCSFLLFKGEEFYLIYPIETNQNIDNEYLNEDNVTIGEKYFINSLVFSRAEESDNIYRNDATNIELNGLHEYKISDNQLLSTNDRDLYIDEMWEYLKTFELYIFDVSSKGILFLEACDRFNFILSDNTYPTILLNNEIAFEDGLSENLYIDKPEETETEYKYADTTDKRINQTYLLVDKQNQKIESVINHVTEQNNKISQVTQTVDELNSKIQDIADITSFGESMYAKVELDSINESEPIQITVKPTVENISYLYPHTNLFPSDTLYPKVRTIRFINKSLEETDSNKYIDYILPDDLLIAPDGTYDEFYLGYDEQVCQVTKRCQYNADGTVSKLEQEQITSYEYPKLELKNGDYAIELLGYTNAYLSLRLMAQNIYTTQFATKAEVKSEISQKADEVNISVDKKLSNYSTTTQMNSAINVKANEITSTVKETYETKDNASTNYSKLTQTATSLQSQINSNDTDISTLKQTSKEISTKVEEKVDGKKIISTINQSAETVGINANKIELSANDVLNLLAGNTINLSSNNIVISSDFLEITKYGKMKLKGKVQTTDLLRIENISGNDFAYYSPDSWGIVRDNGSIYATAEGGGFSTSTIELNGTGGTTNVKNTGISSPEIVLSGTNTKVLTSGSYNNYIGTGSNYSGITTNLRGNTVRLYAHSSGAVYLGYSGSTAVTSDENLKDIYEIDDKYIEFFKNLKPITYIYKDRGHRNHMGFGARQVEEALIKAGLTTEQFAGVLKDTDVTISADEMGTEKDIHYDELYSLRYEEFIALNTMMIQKQAEDIKQLQNEIKELKGEK